MRCITYKQIIIIAICICLNSFNAYAYRYYSNLVNLISLNRKNIQTNICRDCLIYIPILRIKMNSYFYNGYDLSEKLRKVDQHITIWKTEEGLLFLSNEGLFEGSYGRMKNLNMQIFDPEFLNGKILSFNWNYKNSYDDNTGIAWVDISISKNRDGYHAVIVIKAGIDECLIYGILLDVLE